MLDCGRVLHTATLQGGDQGRHRTDDGGECDLDVADPYTAARLGLLDVASELHTYIHVFEWIPFERDTT